VVFASGAAAWGDGERGPRDPAEFDTSTTAINARLVIPTLSSSCLTSASMLPAAPITSKRAPLYRAVVSLFAKKMRARRWQLEDGGAELGE
jgi:hypothetical protein